MDKYGRKPGSVTLLAVSKRQPLEKMKAAIAAGLYAFGENYLQDALEKIEALADYDLQWHFIGAIQSRKAREIAQLFAWVHSVDRLKIANMLSQARPANLEPLNSCLQVNVDDEANKAGVSIAELPALAAAVAPLPHLCLRGLMAIPAIRGGRESFAKLRRAFDELNVAGFKLDTLSMGMSADLETAIAEGATIVRVGTDIFGQRL